MISDKLRSIEDRINKSFVFTIFYIVMGFYAGISSYDTYYEEHRKSFCMSMTIKYCLEEVNYRERIEKASFDSAFGSGIVWPIHYIILLRD